MTIYMHTKICLIVSILSLAACALGMYLSANAVIGGDYLLGSAVAFAGGFFVREYLVRQDVMPPCGNEDLDELPPVLTTAALMTIWIPVALTAAAVLLMLWWDVSAQKISWILIVLAGMCGQHLASMKSLIVKP